MAIQKALLIHGRVQPIVKFRALLRQNLKVLEQGLHCVNLDQNNQVDVCDLLTCQVFASVLFEVFLVLSEQTSKLPKRHLNLSCIHSPSPAENFLLLYCIDQLSRQRPDLSC